jgi:hypothetical protein
MVKRYTMGANMNITYLKNNQNQNSVSEASTNQLSKKDMIKMIKEAYDKVKFGTDEEKSDYENKIKQKIQNGKKLTASEMNYIREKDLIAYTHILRVQTKRDCYLKKLNNCKSKKEVQEAFDSEMSGIHDKDPDKVAIMRAVDDATKEFRKTSEYRSLPEKSKEELEKSENKSKVFYDTCVSGYQETYTEETVMNNQLNITI